jgi:hydroxymethylbilane synthase
MTHLRVGARGSDLSRAQTGWTMDRLREANPGLTLELVIIHTHGDKDQTTPLAELSAPGGAGGFVKEIERALLDNRVDLAVHSLKDVPTVDTLGLTIAGIPRRAPAEDVLLTRVPVNLAALPQGFTIGTSSPRRDHQIRKFAPQVKTAPIRGNVPTRIRHMMEGRFDAIVLAAAGLERLSIQHAHQILLPAKDFPPAPGQGALAVQTRVGGAAIPFIAKIHDPATAAAVTAERSFLQATGGGCHAALGAWATVRGESLTLLGELFIDGESHRDEVSGEVREARQIGQRLAAKLVKPSGATA